jgi:hypothetical protein
VSRRRQVATAALAAALLAGTTGYGATRLPPATTCEISADFFPDTDCTPGAVSGAVTQGNIKRTICRVGGYTGTVRPPSSYTNRLKRHLMASYGLPGEPREYELDHFIPLALGGEPRGPANLWPQPYETDPGAHDKDKLEVKLQRMVCKGDLTLRQAQDLIRDDWISAWRTYVGEP